MNNFAILDIDQIPIRYGFEIVITTNTPCHLFLHFTKIEPEKHKTAIYRRGIRLMDATRYCFVVWEANEQQEAGDTLIHTFTKEAWDICETRWFTFKGTVSGTPSPSVGPIFKKHRVLPPYWRLINEPWTIDAPIPDYELIIDEPWTIDAPIPDYTLVHEEKWSS
ncbi:unnamed protein product [marine sediment metagenome]|uniref:Uncharacterized protein n=1 Tax=marine sediment metagenome TaxID=412755 RepID=X1K4E3_9ZZZZ